MSGAFAEPVDDQPFLLGRAVRVHLLAVPPVAVTNTVVGYLRQYAEELQRQKATADEPVAENAEDPAHQG
ncbi:hypothetical protein [Streptomyces sp. NPDC003996]